MSVKTTSKFGLNELVAAVVGSILGAIPAGMFMQIFGGGDPHPLELFAWLIGGSGMATGWVVWMVSCLGFGLFFGFAMSRTINGFTNTIIMFSRNIDSTKNLLVPLLHKSALGLTGWGMGLTYGNVLGFGFFAYVVPILLGFQGFRFTVPLANFIVIFAYLIYTQILGGTYGVLLEQKWFNPAGAVDVALPSTTDEMAAGLKGSVVAGLVSGLVIVAMIVTGIVSASSDPLLGATGLLTGFGIWMALSVLMGVAFAGYVSRTINDFTNTVIMFSRRSALTQKILVPLIRRAALTVTAGSMGLGYGLALGIAFFLVALVSPIPSTTPLVVAPFVVYGQVLGTAYGLQLEDVDFSLPSLGSESDTDTETDPMAEREGFAAWRAHRPFAGSSMLILAGLIIGAIPLRLQTLSVTAGASKAALGIVFAAMVVACGVFALLKPELSTLIGVTGVAMSILSLIGAFGGLVIGMLVGIAGGNLCIAWQDPDSDEGEATSESRFDWIGEGERQQW